MTGQSAPRRFQPLRYSVTRDVVEDWGPKLVELRGQRLLSLHAQWEDPVPGPKG